MNNKILMSDFIWMVFDQFKEERKTVGSGFVSPEMVQTKVREKIGDATVITDTLGQEVHESKAMACFSDNQEALKKAYDAGDKDAFVEIVYADQAQIDAYYEEKRKQELEEAEEAGEVDPGFNHPLG